MTKKADAGGWTGKNKMPAPIPPYKTPRQVNVEGTRTTRSKKTVVLITETEEQASDSEEETQFGLVWEKMTEEQIKMAAEQKKMADEQKKMAEEQKKMADEPKPIEYVGHPWKDKSRPIVLITETEETERQASDNEEDNIPLSQIHRTTQLVRDRDREC
jgi:hypothetical protein